jgi:hypothetical protein
MKIIPAGATIAALGKKAADCEEKAKQKAGSEAIKLREEALLYREWISALTANGIRRVVKPFLRSGTYMAGWIERSQKRQRELAEGADADLMQTNRHEPELHLV